jgi:TolA-binding protein
MKKAIIIVVIVLALIGSLEPYSSYKAEQGFKKKQPEQCMSGAMLKQRMFNYSSALNIYKKVIQKFPEYSELSKCYYYIGFCYEKTDREKNAIESYEEYVDKFPSGEFAAIAKKRAQTMRANSLE